MNQSKGVVMKKSLAIALSLAILSAVITSAPQAIASECSAGDPCGTWAMLDSQGVITNVIVCQASVCGGGTWDGQRVVPQLAPNPVTHDTTGIGSHWGTYDSNTREFTVDRNGPNQTPASTQTNSETRVEINSEGVVVSTTKIETMTPAVTKTFKYEDTIKNPNDFDKSGQPINGWVQSYLKDKELPNNSPATIKVVKEFVEDEITRIKSENLTLMSRMTETEITEVARAENAMLIIDNIVSVVRLLNSWMKTLMPDLK